MELSESTHLYRGCLNFHGPCSQPPSNPTLPWNTDQRFPGRDCASPRDHTGDSSLRRVTSDKVQRTRTPQCDRTGLESPTSRGP